MDEMACEYGLGLLCRPIWGHHYRSSGTAPEKSAERFQEEAQVMRGGLGCRSGAQTPGSGLAAAAIRVELVITPEVRRSFLVETVRRDRSFATAQDPETLHRLGESAA